MLSSLFTEKERLDYGDNAVVELESTNCFYFAHRLSWLIDKSSKGTHTHPYGVICDSRTQGARYSTTNDNQNIF